MRCSVLFQESIDALFFQAAQDLPVLFAAEVRADRFRGDFPHVIHQNQFFLGSLRHCFDTAEMTQNRLGSGLTYI